MLLQQTGLDALFQTPLVDEARGLPHGSGHGDAALPAPKPLGVGQHPLLFLKKLFSILIL